MTSKSTPIKIIFTMTKPVNNNISLQIRESQTEAGREARTSLSYGGRHEKTNQHIINHNEISQLLDKYIFTHKDNYNYVDNKNAISMFSQLSLSTSSDVKLYFTFKNYSIFTQSQEEKAGCGGVSKPCPVGSGRNRYLTDTSGKFKYISNTNAILYFYYLSLQSQKDCDDIFYTTTSNYSIFTKLLSISDEQILRHSKIFKSKRIHLLDKYVDDIIRNDRYSKATKDSMLIRLALLRSSKMQFIEFGDEESKTKVRKKESIYKNRKHIMIVNEDEDTLRYYVVKEKLKSFDLYEKHSEIRKIFDNYLQKLKHNRYAIFVITNSRYIEMHILTDRHMQEREITKDKIKKFVKIYNNMKSKKINVYELNIKAKSTDKVINLNIVNHDDVLNTLFNIRYNKINVIKLNSVNQFDKKYDYMLDVFDNDSNLVYRRKLFVKSKKLNASTHKKLFNHIVNVSYNRQKLIKLLTSIKQNERIKERERKYIESVRKESFDLFSIIKQKDEQLYQELIKLEQSKKKAVELVKKQQEEKKKKRTKAIILAKKYQQIAKNSERNITEEEHEKRKQLVKQRLLFMLEQEKPPKPPEKPPE